MSISNQTGDDKRFGITIVISWDGSGQLFIFQNQLFYLLLVYA